MTVRGRVVGLRDTLRTELWPAPTAGVLLALLAGVLLPELDRAVDDNLPAGVTAYLFGGGASAARTVLDAVASSLITVTSLTFSLTVVTLQLASGQFSPRLLRTFTRDRFVHFTLAMFLATFVYALTVLRTVRSVEEEQAQFVPQISVTLAFVLAVASVISLVLFLAHLAREIRVETMLHGVHLDASATISRILSAGGKADGQPESDEDEEVSIPSAGAAMILAQRSGFLTAVDHQALRDAASDFDAVVVIELMPGGFAVEGTPVGWYRGVRGSVEVAEREAFEKKIDGALSYGKERNDTQDIAFALRQLTDVTTKALSPGINDPTTAVHSLGHASALICEMAQYDLRDQLHYDKTGRLRVICRRPGFGQLLDDAITQPRRYGAADTAVLIRLFGMLREIAWTVHSAEQRTAVAQQLERLQGTAVKQDLDDTERSRLDSCRREVLAALQGRWNGIT